MKISIFSGQIISLRVATLSPPPPQGETEATERVTSPPFHRI